MIGSLGKRWVSTSESLKYLGRLKVGGKWLWMKQPRDRGKAETFQPRDMWRLCSEIPRMFGSGPNEPKSTGDFSTHWNYFTKADPFAYESFHFNTKKKKVHVSIWWFSKTNCGYMANQQCWSNSLSMEMLLQNHRRNGNNFLGRVVAASPQSVLVTDWRKKLIPLKLPLANPGNAPLIFHSQG